VNKPEDIILVCCNDNGNPRLLVPQAFGIDTAKDDLGATLEERALVEPPFLYFDRQDVAKNPALAAVARPLCQLIPRPLPDEQLRSGDKVTAVVAVKWSKLVSCHAGDLAFDLSKLVAGGPVLIDIDHRPVGLVEDVVLVEVTGKVR